MEDSSRDKRPVRPTAHKVIVSGYPSFTQPQDIARTFSQYGNLKLDRVTSKFSTLTFLDEEDAQAAVQDSMKINIYGEFLTVKPLQANHAQLNTPKRISHKANRKIVIDPQKIDMSGDFHEQLDNVMAAVRLTKDEVTNLSTLYVDLERVLQQQWPGCTTVPFGSITTGLGIKSSDADCFIEVPRPFQHPNPNSVNKAKRLLQANPRLFAEVLAIPRANTPIVKFFHIPTATNCDVTFKTPLGTQNSKLIAFLLHTDPRFIPMAVMIKYWAKVHGFSGTGKLSNYALTMMIIFYLQLDPISILPSVHWLQTDPANDCIIDHWNAGFMARHDQLPRSSNTSSISELLGGFFEFYSTFNFVEMIVCPYIGYPIKKDIFKDLNQLPDEFQRYKNNINSRLTMPLKFTTSMCVQDPIEQSHNVASAVTHKMATEIKYHLKFAANAYEKDKLNGCKDFLKTILREKPKIPRDKPKVQHRINVSSKDIASIEREDWKSVIRELVVETLFEQMLLIKLSKLDEKVTKAATKKERVKFIGTLTKAIWKRKQFSRLYTELSIVDKQKRITEDLMKTEKDELKLQFQLIFTFTNSPRSAAISVKTANGNVDMFREFGKFFTSYVLTWFKALVHQYMKPEAAVAPVSVAEVIKTLDANLDTSSDED